MAEPRVFPDAEDAVLALIEPLLPEGANSGTRTPAELPAVFVLVYRYGGADDGLTDSPLLLVTVYAATRAVGRPLAEQIRSTLVPGPNAFHSVSRGGVWLADLDGVRCTQGPIELPYTEKTRRWVAQYQAKTRRT